MKIIPVILVFLGACSQRHLTTVPPLFPKETTFQRCWTDAESKYWECDYTVEGKGVEFLHKRVPIARRVVP